MIRSTKAVSEVLGRMLILTTMMIVIGLVMVAGVPMIDSAKHTAKMDVAVNSFLSLQNDIEEVVRGPIWVQDPSNITDITGTAPSREAEFELMEGTLSEFPSSTNLICTENEGEYTINISTGTIEYWSGYEFIVYENGAVMRMYSSGTPIIVSDPLINIYNSGKNYTIVSIHAINLTGTVSSTAGESKAWVEIRLKYYNQTIESTGAPNSNQTNILIFSEYPGAWSEFFDKELSGAGLSAGNKGNPTGYNISGTMPMEVQIYGMDIDKDKHDIFLSVYDSGVDLEIS
jgi:hypothetical protein